MGYGIDGKVPLRWKQPEDKEERSILSGYYIERRLDGESQFTQINDEPVVVTYVLDILGIYFESPVFYEDEVENGRTAEYRIRSIDVFGRTSEYSDVIKLRVEKVTPPNAPSIGAPVYSGDDSGRSLRENDSVSRDFSGTEAKKELPSPYTQIQRIPSVLSCIVPRPTAPGPTASRSRLPALTLTSRMKGKGACPGHWMDPDSLKEE